MENGLWRPENAHFSPAARTSYRARWLLPPTIRPKSRVTPVGISTGTLYPIQKNRLLGRVDAHTASESGSGASPRPDSSVRPSTSRPTTRGACASCTASPAELTPESEDRSLRAASHRALGACGGSREFRCWCLLPCHLKYGFARTLEYSIGETCMWYHSIYIKSNAREGCQRGTHGRRTHANANTPTQTQQHTRRANRHAPRVIT